MKHGVRIWSKKLNRSPTHRKSLMANLIGQLVHHEQITTTLAKAQFLKHEMESVINLAKGASERDFRSIKEKLNNTTQTLPKIMHILAPRYSNSTGGYVRMIKNGFRASGSDRAPLAIVELVGNPNDIKYHQALKEAERTREQLEKAEGEKYTKTRVVLRSLVDGSEVIVNKLSTNPALKGTEFKKITRVETAIHRKIVRQNKSLLQYPHFRAVDEQSLLHLEDMRARKAAVAIARSAATSPIPRDESIMSTGRMPKKSVVIRSLVAPCKLGAKTVVRDGSRIADRKYVRDAEKRMETAGAERVKVEATAKEADKAKAAAPKKMGLYQSIFGGSGKFWS